MKKMLKKNLGIYHLKNAPATSSGMGFLGWLTIVFIVLKLTGYIAWSWWWVLAPFWIPISIVLGMFVVFLCVCAFLKMVQ